MVSLHVQGPLNLHVAGSPSKQPTLQGKAGCHDLPGCHLHSFHCSHWLRLCFHSKLEQLVGSSYPSLCALLAGSSSGPSFVPSVQSSHDVSRSQTSLGHCLTSVSGMAGTGYHTATYLLVRLGARACCQHWISLPVQLRTYAFAQPCTRVIRQHWAKAIDQLQCHRQL